MGSYSWIVIVVSIVQLKGSYSGVTVKPTETGFTVWIEDENVIKLFDHDVSEAAFSISGTNVNYYESLGNFHINETLIRDKLYLDDYEISKNELGGRVHWSIILTSSLDPAQGIKLNLWESEILNGVQASCSFGIEILNQTDAIFNTIWVRVPSNQHEKFYGLGEQFTHFNLKGNNFTIWTREQGVGRNQSDPLTHEIELRHPGTGGDYDSTYWPQPSFISAQNRYHFGLKSNTYAVFNFQHSDYTEIRIQARKVEGFFIHDETSLLNLVGKVSQIYGRQPNLPEWVYNGAILGIQGGTEKMLSYLAQAEQHDVPIAALWIQDWPGKINTDFGTRVFWNWKWNESWYPDLDEIIQDLKANKNIRVLAYINPYLNTAGELFAEGDSHGLFLRSTSNASETYRQNFGQFYGGTLDIWNAEAFEWYKNIIKRNLLGVGFSGWMADFGEYTPLDSVSNVPTELSSEERHNQLPMLWAKLNREAVEEEGMLEETIYWMRSGTSGSGGFANMLWGGDQNVDWSRSDGLASTITAGLSAGVSGMGLYHFDIGGYTTMKDIGLTRSKELLLRSAEYAVFTPMMRTHEGNQPAANHQVYTDSDTWKKFGRLTRMFVMLSNYTKSIVKETAETGIPVMRPLFFHYEDDLESYEHDYQYLLGRDLLIAPVLEEFATDRKLYLPPDEWIYLWNDPSMMPEAVLNGPSTITIQAPLGYTPVFFRKGSPFTQLFQNIRSNFYSGYRDSSNVDHVPLEAVPEPIARPSGGQCKSEL